MPASTPAPSEPTREAFQLWWDENGEAITNYYGSYPREMAEAGWKAAFASRAPSCVERAAVVEECARVCEKVLADYLRSSEPHVWNSAYHATARAIAMDCAAAIRARNTGVGDENLSRLEHPSPSHAGDEVGTEPRSGDMKPPHGTGTPAPTPAVAPPSVEEVARVIYENYEPHLPNQSWGAYCPLNFTKAARAVAGLYERGSRKEE